MNLIITPSFANLTSNELHVNIEEDIINSNINTYKIRLLHVSEQHRLTVLESDDYDDKLKFIETQLRYLYYCNNIKKMYDNDLVQRIINEIDNKNKWHGYIIF